MYLIDTNTFLEVMLSRSRKDECKQLLAMLKNGKISGVVTDFTIHFIIVLLDRLRKLKELKKFLLIITAVISINVDIIISFDKNFDGLKIPRKEPAQIRQK